MTTLRDLPVGHYVMVCLNGVTSGAVPHDDPLAPLARRWIKGKRKPGDEEAVRAWLAAHPQFEITRVPVNPPTPAPQAPGQLAFEWDAA